MDTSSRIVATLLIISGVVLLFVAGVGIICEQVYGLVPVWLQ